MKSQQEFGADSSADESRLATKASTGRKPALVKLPIVVRLAAVVVAAFASIICVGLQIGLVAMYSGEGEALMAKLRPSVPSSQVVATALHSGSEKVAVERDARTRGPASAEQRTLSPSKLGQSSR